VTGSDTAEVERRGRVQIITLAREHKRNVIDASITTGLDAALNELDDDPNCGSESSPAEQKYAPRAPTCPVALVNRHLATGLQASSAERSKPLIAASVSRSGAASNWSCAVISSWPPT
jgi:hypothetical protein